MNFLKDFDKNGKAVGKYVVFNLQNYAPMLIHDTKEEAIEEARKISESPSYNHQPLFVMKIEDVFIQKMVRFGTKENLYPKEEETTEENGSVVD